MSCKLFPPEIPIKNCKLPKYLPQQFGPYYDDDPNSVIKYKDIPTYLTSRLQEDIKNKLLLQMEVKNHSKDKNIIEPFNDEQYNYTALLIAICIIIVFLLFNKWIISTFT
jgi:hypothetical protein